MNTYKTLNGETRGYEDKSDLHIGEVIDVLSKMPIMYWAGVESPGELISKQEYEKLEKEGISHGGNLGAFTTNSSEELVAYEDAYDVQITITSNGDDKEYNAYFNDADYLISTEVALALKEAGARVDDLPEDFS